MKVGNLKALLTQFPDDFDVLARNVEQMEHYVTEVVQFGKGHVILIDASDGVEFDEYEASDEDDDDEDEGEGDVAFTVEDGMRLTEGPRVHELRHNEEEGSGD